MYYSIYFVLVFRQIYFPQYRTIIGMFAYGHYNYTIILYSKPTPPLFLTGMSSSDTKYYNFLRWLFALVLIDVLNK